MVFYFTGTGSSLDIARQLDTDLLSIPFFTGEFSNRRQTIGKP